MFWLPELLLWELKWILSVVGGRERGTLLNRLCEELSRPSPQWLVKIIKTKHWEFLEILLMAYSKWRNIYSKKSTKSWKDQPVCGIRTIACFPPYTLLPIQSDWCLLPAGVSRKTVPALPSPALSLGPWFLLRRCRPPAFLIPSSSVLQILYSRQAHLTPGLLSSTGSYL